jgi:hypothetical protein
MTRIVQDGDFIHFVEVVRDTPDVKVYRVRAGKWPKLVWRDSPRYYPAMTAETPECDRWKHGDATFVVSLVEDGWPMECGTVEFCDADAGCEWLVATEKRCVWVVLLRHAPPSFAGFE